MPFTALPVVLAEWLWIGCLLAAGGLALRLAGVRDWRVYAAALVMPPVVGSLFYGAVDLLLLLGLAACWRWRDSAGKAGCALGAIIALKLIALPLVLWFVATRRWRAAGLSLAVAGALAVAGWAVIGLGEIGSYPHLLSLLTDIESARGFSAVAFASAFGAGASTAAWAPYVAGAALVVALFAVARRGPSADGATFLLGVLAALAFSPIVWQHSIVLLLAPLAVLRPRFGVIWTLPLLLWFAPDTSGVVPASQLVLFALVLGAMCFAALQSRPSPARAIAAARARVDHARVSAALQRRSLRARAPELARVCRRVLVVLLFGILPASLLLAILVGSFRSGTGAWAIDFDGNFLRPAHEILRGVSPYHPAELEHVRRAVAAGHRPDEFHDGVFPAYPAPALLLGVPFSYLPLGLAEWIWAGCMLLAGGLALRLVGVRDWRVYGVALLTPAAMSSVLLGAVDFALMLGIAACWRWRDHAGRAGLALGAIVALKLVAAPLVAWLLVTRRWRAAATAGAVAVGLWLAGWAAIGFHGLSGYPHVLSLLTDIESDRGYSAVAYANLIGISGQAASLAPYVLGIALLGVLWRVSKRRAGGRRGGLPRRCAPPLRLLTDRLAPLPRAAVRAARDLLPALRADLAPADGLLGRLARCVPVHRPRGAAGVPRRDRGHLRLDADAHARCRRPGGRSRGAAWHTARVAMRPTYRVRIEYCVP